MIAVFTPTRLKGGFDVTYNALLRQNRDDILWLICDKFFWERRDLVENLSFESPFPIFHFDVAWVEGAPRNVTAGYNAAIAIARSRDCDMLISLQDYIWIPDDGIDRFEAAADAYPDQLFSGLTSIAGDPPKEAIADREGLFTIFEEPYKDKPQEIIWDDPRQFLQPTGLVRRNPIEFETNWACIPRTPLHDEDLNFDEDFDLHGCAYENQAYAFRAEQEGYGVWVDMDNHAISLPHKKYFKEIEDREAPMTEANKRIIEEKYEWQAAPDA